MNLVMPWVAYELALPHYGEVGALLCSAIPPTVWSLIELARFRRLDALSMLVLGGIGLSLFAMALGGSPKLLLVREALISGLIGLLFLITVPLRKPLTYHLALAATRRQGDDDGSTFIEWWKHASSRRLIRTITLVWGIGLTAEALLRGWLAWHWTSERFLQLSPWISYGCIGLIMLWTAWYRRRYADALPE